MKPDFLNTDIDIEKMMNVDDYSKVIDLMSATQIMRYALMFPDDTEIIQTKMMNFLTKYLVQNERSN